MLRLLPLIFLASCTLGGQKFGGTKAYQYTGDASYNQQQLNELSSSIVTSYKKDPRQMSWDKVFKKSNGDIKSFSTVSFETIIQPTRAGLSGADKIYLSSKGKQVLTEKLLVIWEEAFATAKDESFTYKRMKELFGKDQVHTKYGTAVKNFGGDYQKGLESDDIFFKEKGKTLSALALFTPVYARDLSLLLVPGYQLFGGPRGNDYQKYYVEELTRQEKLDALFTMLVEIDWQSSREDKITKQSLQEKAIIKIKLTPILSYKNFSERLKKQGKDISHGLPNLNWGSYEAQVDIPIELEKISIDSSLDEIDSSLLRPILKSYADLCIMITDRLNNDFKRMKID